MANKKWFHNHLKQFLDEKGMTIKAFATEINVDYLQMLSIVHGEIDFTEEIFHHIITSKILSDEEKRYMMTTYTKHHVAIDKRERITYVEKCLNGLYNTLLEKGINSKMHSSSSLESKKYEKVELVMEQITSAVLNTYNHAVKDSLLNNHKSELCFEFSLPPVDRLLHEVYQLLQALEGCMDEKVKLIVSVKFNTVIKDGMKVSNIVNLSKYIRFLTLSDFVTLRSERLKADDGYYVLIPNRKIVLNEHGTKCKVSDVKSNDKLIRAVHSPNNILGKKFDSKSLNDYIYSLAKRDNYTNQNQYTLRYTLSSMSMTTELFKRRMINTLKALKLKAFNPSDLKVINKFAYRTKREFNKIRDPQSRVAQYIALEGIEDFIKSQRISDYYGLAGEFEPYEIVAMLYETLKRMHQGFEIRTFSLKDASELSFLEVVKYFEIFMDCGEVMIAKHLDPSKIDPPSKNLLNVSAPSIEYAIVIDDEEVIEAFQLFYEHVMDIICKDQYQSFEAIKTMTLEHFSQSIDPEIIKIVNKINALNHDTMTIEVKVL